jgi:HTH-type transcriptional regulator, sugar sensing transcriptional regulator
MGNDSHKLIKKLYDLGLTEREAKLYLTLLEKKSFTALELQQIAKIPRTKIYEVLQKMIGRGICTQRSLGREKIYEAVEPEVALNRIIKKSETEFLESLEDKKDIATNLIKTLIPKYDENKENFNPLEFIEIFKSKDQIQKKYLQMLDETNKELLTFNKGPYVCDNSSRLNEQQKHETELLLRGGVCRNIYEVHELIKHEWLMEYINDQINHGQQAKVIDFLPIKMIISDSEIVSFPLPQTIGTSTDITLVFIKHRQLAAASKMLFNYLWEQARDFKEVVGELNTTITIANN